jgi:hypothetical protein
MDVEAEIRDLRRVGELEGSFEFLIGQVKGVHRSLLGFQAETKDESRTVRTERKEQFGQVNSCLDRLEKEGKQLRKDLPGLVGDAMRDARARQALIGANF